MNIKFLLTILIFKTAFIANGDSTITKNAALDLNLFENVLNPELCDEQINYIIKNDTQLLLTFLEAGIRMPRGILIGNTIDLGNYYQCLDIHQEIPESIVEGKYCMITVPLGQDISLPDLSSLPDFPWPEFNLTTNRLSDRVAKGLNNYNRIESNLLPFFGGLESGISRNSERNTTLDISLTVAVCIPKVCSTERVFNTLLNITDLGFRYDERFCRLPNDKPWVAADYVAIAIFSVIIFLVILSTAYDVINMLLERDPKDIKKLYVAFSAYTNTRNLVTYKPSPGVIECLDGIRSLAMMWVLLGHAFIYQLPNTANTVDAVQWFLSLKSIWITSAHITVDTFFMLSGVLVVYTTRGKVTSTTLLKNLHLFYLYRILRIFPMLAAMVLIQASFSNWVIDGPLWTRIINNVENCRLYWWSALLHIQNYYNPDKRCVPSSWYLSVDVQLHILSPIILVWVLSGRRKLEWISLIAGLLAVLAAATTFNFIKAFPSSEFADNPQADPDRYFNQYYVNTLTRASPFLVGLVFGYLLSIYRGQRVVIFKILAIMLWICAVTIISLTVYSSYPILQLDWDNQIADNMINSFMRPAWAMALGWIIFACEHGYSGPVDWFLSLRMWKLLSRLSFAMYITHDALLYAMYSIPVTLLYFTVLSSLFNFVTLFSMTFIFAFVMTVLVDSPCTVLIKHFMGGGIKKNPVKSVPNNTDDKNPIERHVA